MSSWSSIGGPAHLLKSITKSPMFPHLSEADLGAAIDSTASSSIDLGSDYAMELGFDELEVL